MKEKNRTKRSEKKGNGRLLYEFMRGSKLLFLGGIIASFAVTGADMLNPQLIRFTVDSVIGNEPVNVPGYARVFVDALGGVEAIRQNLWTIAAAIVAVALAAAVCRYLQRIINTKAAETLVEHMRNMLYEKIQRLPFSWHMKNKTGDIIQRCTSDVDMVKNFLSEQLISILRIVIQVTISLIVMYGMDTRLAVRIAAGHSDILGCVRQTYRLGLQRMRRGRGRAFGYRPGEPHRRARRQGIRA